MRVCEERNRQNGDGNEKESEIVTLSYRQYEQNGGGGVSEDHIPRQARIMYFFSPRMYVWG